MNIFLYFQGNMYRKLHINPYPSLYEADFFCVNGDLCIFVLLKDKKYPDRTNLCF